MNDAPAPALLDEVLAAYAAGLALLPVKEDGSKRPDLREWESFQSERPSEREIHAWRFDQRTGVGVVAGPVSGHRECWDFDTADVFDQFLDAAQASGLAAIVDRIRAGYEDRTPNGGRRWIVTYPDAIAWQDCTLARRPGQDGEPAVKVLIELPTFSIVAPSYGGVHPSARPYVRVSGGFASIAAYTDDERRALIELARTFDAMPKPTHEARPPVLATPAGRPGDDFMARTTWRDVLEPEGWRFVYERGGVARWRRPGKALGVSATTNYANSDLLYVFSSSTAFEKDRGYNRFSAYAVLRHGGDFTEAAKALAQKGYGTPTPTPAEPPDRTACETCGRHECAGHGLPAEGVPPADAHERLVAQELERLRVQREARRRLDAEVRGPVSIPPIVTLRDRLAVDRPPTAFRIDRLQSEASRVFLAAQFKAGKTTLVGNVVRCLVDGDAFLDAHAVVPVTGTVAILDTEMSEAQGEDWLQAQAIHAPRPPKPARTARISSAYQLRAALVRSALQTHGPATVRDLATRTGLTTDQLGTTLARMRHMGDVRVVDVQTARKAYGRDVLQVYGLA